MTLLKRQNRRESAPYGSGADRIWLNPYPSAETASIGAYVFGARTVFVGGRCFRSARRVVELDRCHRISGSWMSWSIVRPWTMRYWSRGSRSR